MLTCSLDTPSVNPLRDLAHSLNDTRTIYVTLDSNPPYVTTALSISCRLLLMTSNWLRCHRSCRKLHHQQPPKIIDSTTSRIQIINMSSSKLFFTLVLVLCFLASSFAFNMRSSTITRNVARIKMEYIPDGVSKEQVSVNQVPLQTTNDLTTVTYQLTRVIFVLLSTVIITSKLLY